MSKKTKSNLSFLETCKECGHKIKDSWSFCPFCKAKIKTYPCPICGEEIKELWQFCPYCSHKNNSLPIDNGYDKGNEWLKNLLKR